MTKDYQNTTPCAHPKIEGTMTTQGENVLKGMVTNVRKLVTMCEQGCGYMETLKITQFGQIDLSEYTYIKP